MTYLKIWEGVVTGSLGGRDDGYPETKMALIDTVEDLTASYDPKAEYFRLESVDKRVIEGAVQAIKELNKKNGSGS